MKTTRQHAARLMTTATAVMAIALSGCGASPTAAKLSSATKKATTAAVTKTVAAATTATKPAAAQTTQVAAAQTTTVAPQTSATNALTAVTSTTDTAAVAPTTTATDTTAAVSTGTPVAAESTADSTAAADANAFQQMLVADTSALTAEITAQKNGVVLGMGSYNCTVLVSNSSDQPKTGVLQLTFMNGENPSKTAPSVQLVTIPAHGSQSFDFKDTAWSTDSAVVNVAETHDGQPLAAFVTMKKNGAVMGLGSYKCSVVVINPDDVEHTGTLVVTFKKGTADSATAPISQSVTLAAHASQSFDFSDPKWTTNNVEATIN